MAKTGAAYGMGKGAGGYSGAGYMGGMPGGYAGQMPGQMPYGQIGGMGMQPYMMIAVMGGNANYVLMISPEGYLGIKTQGGPYLLSPDGKMYDGKSIDGRVKGLYNQNAKRADANALNKGYAGRMQLPMLSPGYDQLGPQMDYANMKIRGQAENYSGNNKGEGGIEQRLGKGAGAAGNKAGNKNWKNQTISERYDSARRDYKLAEREKGKEKQGSQKSSGLEAIALAA